MKILRNLRYGLSWVLGEKFISGGSLCVCVSLLKRV